MGQSSFYKKYKINIIHFNYIILYCYIVGLIDFKAACLGCCFVIQLYIYDNSTNVLYVSSSS